MHTSPKLSMFKTALSQTHLTHASFHSNTPLRTGIICVSFKQLWMTGFIQCHFLFVFPLVSLIFQFHEHILVIILFFRPCKHASPPKLFPSKVFLTPMNSYSIFKTQFRYHVPQKVFTDTQSLYYSCISIHSFKNIYQPLYMF